MKTLNRFNHVIGFIFVLNGFCFGTVTASAASHGDLKIGITQEWSAFNPIDSQLASNDALFSFILRKMVRRGADGSVIADIAEKVPALKKEKNGKFTAVWEIKKMPTGPMVAVSPAPTGIFHGRPGLIRK